MAFFIEGSFMWILVVWEIRAQKYDGTRHNIGFELIDAIGRANGAMGYQNNFHGDTDKKSDSAVKR